MAWRGGRGRGGWGAFCTWEGEAGDGRGGFQSLFQHQHADVIVEHGCLAEVGVVEGVGCLGAALPEDDVKGEFVRDGGAEGKGEGKWLCIR